MMQNKAQHLFCKILKKYFKSSGRVNFELKELSELLRLEPGSIRILKKSIKEKMDSIKNLKVLILFHKLILEGILVDLQLFELISTIKPCNSDEFQNMLQVKFIQPYQLFLQKRSLMIAEAKGYENEEFHRMGRQNRTYHYLNLINRGTAFSDVIYTFGRYYIDQHSYAIDFNILLGHDLQGLYNEMVKAIKRPASLELLDQIELVHQKMYVVFYNCYFHKYLKQHVPKWVITDIKDKKDRKDSKDRKEKSSAMKNKSKSTSKTPVNKTTASTKANLYSISQNLGQSCLFLSNEKDYNMEDIQNEEEIKPVQLKFEEKTDEKYQERVEVLKSMQRVFALFPEG